jgi:transposase-like protein
MYENSGMELTIPALATKIPDENAAYELLEQLRWHGQPVCPHCGSVRPPYFLNPQGEGRKTTRGKLSQRRVWKCSEKQCRKQFSVLTGTIFHGSHIPLRTWLFVVFEMCSAKNGISAREVERKYDLTPKTAWYMLHRIREAMKRPPLVDKLRGIIVADETFIGGKPKLPRGTLAAQTGKRTPRKPKTAVLSLIETESGEARSRVIPNVTTETLYGAIAREVNMRGSTLHTDEHAGYQAVGAQFLGHHTVWHSGGEYVRGNVTTNQAENFFSQLKRSLDGTFHHVSAEHLHRYLAEFDMRYSTRKWSDSARMQQVIDQTAGRRLSYRQPTTD